MSLQLPPATLRKLEQVLAQWRHWRGASELPGAPHLVARLGGISNYTVLAEAAGQRFCVRLDRVNPAANGLNRQAEWRALQSAHAAGLAPRPRYLNPELGALVCDYLPPDEDQSIAPAELANLLRGVHRLPGLHYRLDLQQRVRHYQRQLSDQPHRTLTELELAIAPLLTDLCSRPAGNHLCHNDLSKGNLVRSGGRLYALDWEYCAMGHPWFDVATSCLNTGFGAGQCGELLRHYLQRPLREEDRYTLEEWRCVASYLELLWYLSQRPDYLEQEAVLERVSGLMCSITRSIP